jgi:hypothetical protein
MYSPEKRKTIASIFILLAVLSLFNSYMEESESDKIFYEIAGRLG